MVDFFIELHTHGKIYLYTGLGLLVLAITTSNGKISSRVQQLSYFSIFIWLLCVGYRVITGNDITSLL